MLRAWQTSMRAPRSTLRSEQDTWVQKCEPKTDAVAPQSNSCTSNRWHAARSLAHSTQSLTSPVGPTRSASRKARSPLPQQISRTVAPRVALRGEDSGRDVCVRDSSLTREHVPSSRGEAQGGQSLCDQRPTCYLLRFTHPLLDANLGHLHPIDAHKPSVATLLDMHFHMPCSRWHLTVPAPAHSHPLPDVMLPEAQPVIQLRQGGAQRSHSKACPVI